MLRFKILPVSAILTFMLLACGIGMGTTNGQVTDSAFANCVMMSGGYTVDVVMLGTDDDCDAGLFEQAVKHYKAQGYVERQYSNLFGEQLMSLQR